MRRAPADREAVERVLAAISVGNMLDALIELERALGIREGEWQATALAGPFQDYALVTVAQRIRNETRCSVRQALVRAATELDVNMEGVVSRARRQAKKNGHRDELLSRSGVSVSAPTSPELPCLPPSKKSSAAVVPVIR